MAALRAGCVFNMRGLVAVTITTDVVLKTGAASHYLDYLIGAALRTSLSRPAADIAAFEAYMLLI